MAISKARILLLVAVACAVALANESLQEDADALQAFVGSPLRDLVELAEAAPEFDQSTFEVFGDLQAPLRESQEAEGFSLIDADASASEAQESAEEGKPKGKKGGVPEDLSGGAFAPPVDQREVEFARIQYLQAAIAEKRESVVRQKHAIETEEGQIKRESKLARINKKILQSNEKAIDSAQQELAKLLEGYGKTLKKGFKVSDAAATALPSSKGFAFMKGFKIPEVKAKMPQPPSAPPASTINAEFAGKGKAKGKKSFVEVSSEVVRGEEEIDKSLDETQESIDYVMEMSAEQSQTNSIDALMALSEEADQI